MATPEVAVKKQVRKILTEADAYYSCPVTGGYGSSGAPDFLVCWCGHFIGIECKSGNAKPTPLQQKNLDDITAAGGVVFVIRETNVEVLRSFFFPEGVKNV